jgi:alpha-L-arabinofuranosidase
MDQVDVSRRRFLKAAGLGSAAVALSGAPLPGAALRPADERTLSVDPTPTFELSPYLYMQFMEPLGVTDTSVDAAWDFRAGDWREDVIEISQELAPTLLRWGGCFCSYYRWKEAVGPQDQRKPMLNILWGGIYNNQVGTHEFLDFCNRVGADPLMVVNFESDGRRNWAKLPNGDIRSGDAREAAEWVDYCNNPSNQLRREHGIEKPYGVKLWQIGNETSYDRNGFDVETAGKKTVEFAKAMRKVDSNIDIIGWGDSGWAPRMAEIAGEELQYLAFHNHFNSGGADSPLQGIKYRKDPARTWEFLMRTGERQQRRIEGMREQVADSKIPLALTECHYALPGRNRCEVLSTWAAGVAYARVLNVHERNGDILKFATLADFCGTRWQNNAIMIPVPGGHSYMMPVAMAMSLFRKKVGNDSVKVTDAPEDLDVTASRTGNRVFLHVVNTSRTRSRDAVFALQGASITAGHVRWFDLDPEDEIFEYRPEHTFPKEKKLDSRLSWTFPAASISTVELTFA